jgi:biopolymer transport protein ExbD
VDEDIDSINVVPLVDVMLVLLTIVLTTATFIVSGHIPVDLAVAEHAAGSRATPLVVTLSLDKSIHVNDQPCADIGVALAAFGRATPVVVRADGGLELRVFVELTDRIKGMGFSLVALEVRRS